jgi:hypothetical protein
MSFYSRSVAKALLDIFPEIGMDKAKIHAQCMSCAGVWCIFLLSNADSRHNISIKRKFFENYAKDHGFDPLMAANWYTHAPKLLDTKVFAPLSFIL